MEGERFDMLIQFLSENSSLCVALGIRPGLTALVGGGGKTSAMLRLAGELSMHGSVLISTTTHIFPPPGFPVLYSPDADAVRAVLLASPAVCVGTPAKDGKLSAPPLEPAVLRTLADYVLIEADGAKRLPLKAPATHEPVIPDCADCVVAVAGLDGIGRAISETAFRPALYASLLGVGLSHSIVPKDVARVVCDDLGQHKGVAAHMRFCVLLNKADDAARLALACKTCAALDNKRVERAVIARLGK